MKWKLSDDILPICAIIILAVFYLSAIGCAPKDPYLNAQYVRMGPCLFWGTIEREHKRAIRGEFYFCGAIWHDPMIFCTRPLGHKGKHHCHRGLETCRQVWK